MTHNEIRRIVLENIFVLQQYFDNRMKSAIIYIHVYCYIVMYCYIE